jgi:hypothetical protein
MSKNTTITLPFIPNFFPKWTIESSLVILPQIWRNFSCCPRTSSKKQFNAIENYTAKMQFASVVAIEEIIIWKLYGQQIR